MPLFSQQDVVSKNAVDGVMQIVQNKQKEEYMKKSEKVKWMHEIE
jgi:hypothetical protein